MRPYDHYIVLDSETSGIPKSWDAPVSHSASWPHIIQLAWIVFDLKGNALKRECYYLKFTGVEIEEQSLKVHGITAGTLEKNGASKRGVLKRLFKDLDRYQALLISHFVEFDIKLLAVENERLDLRFNLAGVPAFCTMINAQALTRNPARTYPSLGTLYHTYFDEPLEEQHDARQDAAATARCFFEMVRTDHFSDADIQYFHFDDRANRSTASDALGKRSGAGIIDLIRRILKR